MPWYSGPTLLEQLEDMPTRRASTALPFRFPVQTVLRVDDFRGLAGTVASGRIGIGDPVVDAASGRQAVVVRIATMDGDLEAAESGRAVVLQLDCELDIARGAVLASPGRASQFADGIGARLVWLADLPFSTGQRLLLRTPSDLVPVERMAVKARLDLATLAENAGAACGPNDIVVADIDLGRPAAFDRFADVPDMGAFVLVDALTGATVAGGVVKSVGVNRQTVGLPTFVLTRWLLAEVICAGIAPDDPEFARRAEAVQRLMEKAGVHVRLDLDAS